MRYTLARFAILASLLASLLLGFSLARAQDIDVRPAQAAAEAWLALVDEGNYVGSWQAGAEAFRTVVTREQWAKAVGAARGPQGRVISRKLRSATYSREVPGAPVGEYVVIQYETHFDNRPGSIETVTPMRETDGTWRVSGYFVR